MVRRRRSAIGCATSNSSSKREQARTKSRGAAFGNSWNKEHSDHRAMGAAVAWLAQNADIRHQTAQMDDRAVTAAAAREALEVTKRVIADFGDVLDTLQADRVALLEGIGPVGVLRGEMARRRGHMPIRQLMQRASTAIQALKPVLMMSPLRASRRIRGTSNRVEMGLRH